MNFMARRGIRGAFRETPEDILRRAIAAHKALRDRERWLERQAAPVSLPATVEPRRKPDDAQRGRAKFAEDMARAAFGRFYHKAPAKKGR